MSKSFSNRSVLAGVILVLGTCLGCGTEEYKSRLRATEQRLTQGSAFAQMHPAMDIPDTPLMVRLPPKVERTPLAEGTDPRRLKPPSAEGRDLLPDLKLTYEGFQEYQGGGKTAFYCYLAAPEMSTFRRLDPKRALRSQLREVFPESTGTWEEVPCDTPEGLTERWERLRCTGQQEFYDVDASGKETFRSTDGTLDVFSRPVGDHLVVIAWRVPTVYVGQIELAKWAPRVAGSVTEK